MPAPLHARLNKTGSILDLVANAHKLDRDRARGVVGIRHIYSPKALLKDASLFGL
jgi:hypothetical protein